MSLPVPAGGLPPTGRGADRRGAYHVHKLGESGREKLTSGPTDRHEGPLRPGPPRQPAEGPRVARPAADRPTPRRRAEERQRDRRVPAHPRRQPVPPPDGPAQRGVGAGFETRPIRLLLPEPRRDRTREGPPCLGTAEPRRLPSRTGLVWGGVKGERGTVTDEASPSGLPPSRPPRR